MILPDVKHPGWVEAITAGKSKNYGFLATRILVGRLALNYQLEQTPEKMETSILELRNFFQTNIQQPQVQADLQKVFGERI